MGQVTLRGELWSWYGFGSCDKHLFHQGDDR